MGSGKEKTMKDELCNSVLTMMGYDTDLEEYSAIHIESLIADLDMVEEAINLIRYELESLE